MNITQSNGIATISNNGKTLTIKGGDIEIRDNKIFIDGKLISMDAVNKGKDVVYVSVIVEGNCQNLNATHGDVTINGDCHIVTSKNGNIQCGNVSQNVNTKNGNIRCGTVGGDVNTKNGNISHT